MAKKRKPTSKQVASFWRKHLDILEKQQVNSHERRWNVLHTERFINHQTKLTEVEVSDYFSQLGRNTKLNSFQFRQNIYNIRNLNGQPYSRL